MKLKQFVLLGLPGLNLEAHAAELATRWHIPHLSMNRLVEEAIAKQSQLGQQLQAYGEAGETIPDALLVKVLRRRLQQPDAMLNGWVLNGFPETVAQAKALDEVLVAFGLPDPLVVYLKAMRALLVTRIWSQGGQSEPLPAIRRRLAHQEEALLQVVDYYQGRSQLKAINGSLSFAEVAGDLFHLGNDSTDKVPLIKDEAELDSLLSEQPVLVVDCLASWCGPCKLVTPLINQLADAYGDRAKIMKMDFDANQQIPERFGLEGMPAVMFFKDGQLQETLTGVKPYQAYSATVTRCLESC